MGARLRLRMVVHAGELVADAGSFVSEDLTHAFRLLGSDVAHACLAQTSADLALIVSDWAYDKLVRHGFFGLDPADFQPVLVVAKETRTRAWVRVPGHNRRLDLPAPPEAPGSEWALPLRPSDPERIGPYELTGRLGSGGMGTVYLGLDSNGRRVAVKVLRADHAEDPTFRERFRREVEAARRVPRFCTAPVVGTGGGGQPYLATEYVDGPSLEAAVETGGPLPAGDLEGLGLGMALALTAIHGTGLVHRDLTPGNVLLSRLGPRVIDFGIASALEGTSLHTQGPIGTPSYMAPEQAMGKRVTFAADVFAWGCVVAYAASGRPPFGTGHPGAVTYRVMHEPPDLRGLEGPLRGLVEAAVQKEPQRRPTTAQLLDRLRGPATVPGGWDGDGPDRQTLVEDGGEPRRPSRFPWPAWLVAHLARVRPRRPGSPGLAAGSADPERPPAHHGRGTPGRARGRGPEPGHSRIGCGPGRLQGRQGRGAERDGARRRPHPHLAHGRNPGAAPSMGVGDRLQRAKGAVR